MSKVKVGDYIFQRLAQLGVQTVWGDPGDYELALLDLIDDAGLKFRGNANELIASYSADGYSRFNGVGAFVTTFGPGELSAYCGHAGAYAEFCPVAHVVGYPGVNAMKNKTLMHHSLGTGEFGMYHEMVKHISVDTAVLTDLSTAAADIDRCLTSMLRESRPVYIGVPVDRSHSLISADSLATPLSNALPAVNPELKDQVLSEILKRIASAKHPIIIGDGNVVRNGLVPEADKLATLTKWPYFTTCMGKGGPNESLPNFGGIYQGGGSIEPVRKAAEEQADLVLWLGSFRTDFNTGEMTDFIKEEVTIDFQRFFTNIGGAKHDVGIHTLLPALLEVLEKESSIPSSIKVDWNPYPPPASAKSKGALTQDYLWSALPRIFKSGDIVVGETGTSAFGVAASRLPAGCHGFNQTVFGSIGYAGPSSAGAFQAAKEKGWLRRGILITGEGSLQLTPMCFADFLKLDIKPLVFILNNNNGYTIERLIHGRTAAYNTLPVWDYKSLTSVFGPKHPSKYFGPIKTCEELDELLANPEIDAGETFQVVELILGELDAPESVRLAAAAVERFNQRDAAKGQDTSTGG